MKINKETFSRYQKYIDLSLCLIVIGAGAVLFHYHQKKEEYEYSKNPAIILYETMDSYSEYSFHHQLFFDPKNSQDGFIDYVSERFLLFPDEKNMESLTIKLRFEDTINSTLDYNTLDIKILDIYDPEKDYSSLGTLEIGQDEGVWKTRVIEEIKGARLLLIWTYRVSL